MKNYTNAKKIFILLVLLLMWVMLLCGGCSRKRTARAPEPVLYTVTDATGHKVPLAHKPTRIISLSISTDEILLDLVAPSRIAAVTKYADDGGISNVVDKAKQVQGRIYDTNPEAILALKPDVIILPDFTSQDTVQSLRDMQLAVYVYKTPSDLAGIKACITELGRVVGEEKRAAQLLAGMDADLAKLKARLGNIPLDKQKRVIFMGEKGAYYSPDHSFNDICAQAQVRNALAELKLNKQLTIAHEEIVRLNPDAFVLSGWINKDEQEPAALAHNLRHDASFSTVQAVRDDAIYTLPAKHLLCLSQYIVEAPKDLAVAVYGIKL